MADANGMAVINQHIKQGTYSRVYLLTGSENYLIRQYKDKLLQALIDPTDTMNLAVFKGDDIRGEDIRGAAETLPFFGERRVVLVADSGFFKSGCEVIEDFLPQIPETTVLIFSEMTIDKRSKLYKRVAKEGTVAVFDTPDERTLLTWLRNLFSEDGISVEEAAYYKLLSAAGMDMTALYQEAEKLRCYAIDSGRITAADVDALCVSQAENKIFDMTEALSKRDRKRALSLYEDLLSLREPMMRVLYLITRQYNVLMKVRFAADTGSASSGVASFAKIPPYFVKKYTAIANNYTEKELIACVDRCQQADTNIKTGREKDQLAVELLIMDLLNL